MFKGEHFDLYGPIWVVITLIIVITVFGSLMHGIRTHSDPGLDVAVTHLSKLLIAFYIFLGSLFLNPLILYCCISHLAEKAPKYLVIFAIVGYSYTVFIPVTLLHLVPIETFQMAVLCVGGAINLRFLYV